LPLPPPPLQQEVVEKDEVAPVVDVVEERVVEGDLHYLAAVVVS
jgi:hypothetical protein